MSTIEQLKDLLRLVTEASLPLVESGESLIRGPDQRTVKQITRPTLHLNLSELGRVLDLKVPEGAGTQALFEDNLNKILKYSKLYGSTDPPGVASELMLAFLNQNVHVYEAAPVLTVIEKYVTRRLAGLFGFDGPEAGGISVQGGSASNTTSIVIARNTLFPATKLRGNNVDGLRLVILTSAHGHYSIEKAAQMLGLGSSAVHVIPSLAEGSMDVQALEQSVLRLKSDGLQPFYVNATAGTTVLGSYDPIGPIAQVCEKHGLWLHVDASWGGPAIFSDKHKLKLKGSHLADSIAINPHKMMGVPLTCSFLLGRDLNQFQTSNSSQADYLFHGSTTSATAADTYDLADLTLQCGRRGDSLKLYMSWVYHGTKGYKDQIDGAFLHATHLSELARDHEDIVLVSSCPPPCLQVCFFYAKGRRLKADNSSITQQIVQGLKPHGFLVDYAAIDDRGDFLRPVIHRHVSKTTIAALLTLIVKIGSEVWDEA